MEGGGKVLVQEVGVENEGLILYWFTVTVSAVLVQWRQAPRPSVYHSSVCVSSRNPLIKSFFSVKVKVSP